MPKDIKDNWQEWVNWAVDKFVRKAHEKNKRDMDPSSIWPIKDAKNRGE